MVSEILISKQYKIYPNPTTDIITADYYLNENSSVTIKLTNITGQTIYEQRSNSLQGENNHQIDLSTYKAGLYLLTLKTATGSVTAKIIKQ